MSLEDLCSEIKSRGVKEVKVMNGTVCVNIDGFWYGALGNNNIGLHEIVVQRALSYQKFLDLTREHQEFQDKYLLVSAKDRKYWVGETEGEVLPFQTPESYCGLAGFSKKSAHDMFIFY